MYLVVGIIGSPCQASAECRHAVANSWCSHEVETLNDTSSAVTSVMTSSAAGGRHCACKTGFRSSPDGTFCDDQSIPRDVTIVAVCVFVVALFVIVDGFLIVWLCRAFVCRYSRPSPSVNSADIDDDDDSEHDGGQRRRKRDAGVVRSPWSTDRSRGDRVRQPVTTWRELVGVWNTSEPSSDRNMNQKLSRDKACSAGNGVRQNKSDDGGYTKRPYTSGDVV